MTATSERGNGLDHRLHFLLEPATFHAPTRATFAHDTPHARGEVALDYWPARTAGRAPPKHLFLFILGNPALLEYYHPFLSRLHANLPPTHAILATSHIGHTPGLACPDEPLHLLAQLEAKVELVGALRTFLDDWPHHNADSMTTASSASSASKPLAPRLSLIGHSVGSWLAVETAKRLPNAVHSTFMLFPTVGWIARSRNGRTLWPIFTRPLRALIPYLSYLVRPILPLTTFPAPTLALLRSPRTIAHALGLARTEMDTIRAPDLAYFARASASTSTSKAGGAGGAGDAGDAGGVDVYGIWSAGRLDKWVGEEGPQVQLALGGEEGGRVKILQGVPHAFCLSETHSHNVAGVLANWIDPSSGAREDERGAAAVHSGMPM